MSQNKTEKSGQLDSLKQLEGSQLVSDEASLMGLSALLLTFPPTAPPPFSGERRQESDRRVGDRRLRAREFSVPD